jgi:hypothetical protein
MLYDNCSVLKKEIITAKTLKRICEHKYPLLFKNDFDVVFDKVIEIANFMIQFSKKYANFSKFLDALKISKLLKRIEFHIKYLYGIDGI